MDVPTVALIGEAGRELVLPLTDPVRARELAAQAGLYDLLAEGATSSSRSGQVPGAGTVINVEQNITPAYSDPVLVAEQVLDRLVAEIAE